MKLYEYLLQELFQTKQPVPPPQQQGIGTSGKMAIGAAGLGAAGIGANLAHASGMKNAARTAGTSAAMSARAAGKPIETAMAGAVKGAGEGAKAFTQTGGAKALRYGGRAALIGGAALGAGALINKFRNKPQPQQPQ